MPAIMMQLNAGKIGSPFFPGMFCPSNTCKLMMLGCWEQSHHIKCEKRQCQKGFPLFHRFARTYFRYRLTFWCRQPRVSVPIKKRPKEAEAQTGGAFLAGHFMTDTGAGFGHPSKIHFSCSKDNLNVANIQQRDAPLVGLPFKRYLQLPSEQSQGNPLLSSFGCCLP